MAMRIETGQRVPEVRRVAALSASFFLHAAAALVVALPLAPVVRRAPPPVEVAVLHQEAPPPPPVPPEPQPPAVERPHPHAHPAPLHAKSEPVLPVATEHVSPVTEAPPSSGAVAASTAAQGSAADAGSDAGEDRALAYSTPLKLRYPVASLRQHEQGRVLLHVLVDADGAVQRIEIVRGSGHPALDAAARAAVQEARFQPVLRDGHAVAAWGLVPIEFRLGRG